ncbi:hypothetical protein [Gramella sp. KN1008]|uniref:hypothetical protein n=1 Tax=Gramella sp. KN1008 TaxID=2529298 RepID=UPI001039152E|nr:hypothetical protein [Gramella sp. KN1008]TBW28244.1 hypothetical protein EZJ28_05725 [Gramella sp. KN1008]
MTIGFFLILSLFSNPGEEAFCTCRPPVEINMEEIEDYALIFRGVVQKLDTVDQQRQITFKLKKIYKGDLETDSVSVSTSLDLSMCGLNIGTEGEWLLFAYKDDTGSYSTNSCTRSGIIDSYLDHIKQRVEDDLVFLENLKK